MFTVCVELREIPRPARLLDLEPRRLNRNKMPPGSPAPHPKQGRATQGPGAALQLEGNKVVAPAPNSDFSPSRPSERGKNPWFGFLDANDEKRGRTIEKNGDRKLVTPLATRTTEQVEDTYPLSQGRRCGHACRRGGRRRRQGWTISTSAFRLGYILGWGSASFEARGRNKP